MKTNKIKFAMVKSGGQVHAYNASRNGKLCGRIIPVNFNAADSVKWSVVEGLPESWVRGFKSLSAAKAALSAYYESLPPARINLDKCADAVNDVMRDLKNQGETKATAVLEMIEGILTNAQSDTGSETITQDAVEEIIEAISDMGPSGLFSANQLRRAIGKDVPPAREPGGKKWLTTADGIDDPARYAPPAPTIVKESPPCQQFSAPAAPFSFLEMAHNYRVIIERLELVHLTLGEYMGKSGRDENSAFMEKTAEVIAKAKRGI